MKETDELLSFLKSALTMDEFGVLRWKPRPATCLKNRQWNGRFAGRVAGTLRRDGYLRIGVNFGGGLVYVLNHRVVYSILHGKWPVSDIDHINQIKSDNRPCNLREASRANNIANRTQVNSTGRKGVKFDRRSGRFQARITHKGVTINLGTFSCPDMAHEAYCEAAKFYYGEFTDTGGEK